MNPIKQKRFDNAMIAILAAIFIAVWAYLLTGCAAPKSMQLTVTFLHREEDSMTYIEAKHGNIWWQANCKDLPDSVKLGTVFTADPIKKPDTCKCVFKRIKYF